MPNQNDLVKIDLVKIDLVKIDLVKIDLGFMKNIVWKWVEFDDKQIWDIHSPRHNHQTTKWMVNKNKIYNNIK